MINRKKKEEVITEMNGSAFPMLDVIAKITAEDFDESEEFEYDSAHTVLICDLIMKLYLRGEYKEAMEVLALSFLISEMDYSGELISIAAAGYTDENGKFYLDSFFNYSNIFETYELGKHLYTSEEDDDVEDNCYM